MYEAFINHDIYLYMYKLIIIFIIMKFPSILCIKTVYQYL